MILLSANAQFRRTSGPAERTMPGWRSSLSVAWEPQPPVTLFLKARFSSVSVTVASDVAKRQCPLFPEAIEVVRTTDRSAGPRIVIEAAGNRTSFTVSVPEKPERSTVSPAPAEAMAAFRASDVNAAGAMVAAETGIANARRERRERVGFFMDAPGIEGGLKRLKRLKGLKRKRGIGVAGVGKRERGQVYCTAPTPHKVRKCIIRQV